MRKRASNGQAVFVHRERASTPLLAPCLGKARLARADGLWVRDAQGFPVLVHVAPGNQAGETPALATGVIVEVPDMLLTALDLMWRGTGITQATTWATASLRREPVIAWLIEDLRHAQMYGYRIPKGVRHG